MRLFFVVFLDYGRGKTTVDIPDEMPFEQEDVYEEEEEDEDGTIEYVDINTIAQPQQSSHHHHHLHNPIQQEIIIQEHDMIEEYSEEDTIIEESY